MALLLHDPRVRMLLTGAPTTTGPAPLLEILNPNLNPNMNASPAQAVGAHWDTDEGRETSSSGQPVLLVVGSAGILLAELAVAAAVGLGMDLARDPDLLEMAWWRPLHLLLLMAWVVAAVLWGRLMHEWLKLVSLSPCPTSAPNIGTYSSVMLEFLCANRANLFAGAVQAQ